MGCEGADPEQGLSTWELGSAWASASAALLTDPGCAQPRAGWRPSGRRWCSCICHTCRAYCPRGWTCAPGRQAEGEGWSITSLPAHLPCAHSLRVVPPQCTSQQPLLPTLPAEVQRITSRPSLREEAPCVQKVQNSDHQSSRYPQPPRQPVPPHSGQAKL